MAEHQRIDCPHRCGKTLGDLTMELLDRYLQAVRFWLPRKRQEDITRELAEDLRSEIEEKEASLGRRLNDAELEQILRRWGAPVTVAVRYLPSQCLIGPLLLPLFWFVIRVVLLWVLVPLFLIVSVSSLMTAAHPWTTALWVVGQYFQSAIFAVGMITLVFGLLERVQPDCLSKKAWNPRDLPAVRPPDRDELSRTKAALELIGCGFFLVWATGCSGLPIVGIDADPSLHVTPAPVWHALHWPILALAASMTGLSACNLVRPWWTRWRAAVRLANHLVALGLVGWLLRASSWVQIEAPALPPGKAAQVDWAINLGLLVAFFWFAAAIVVSIVRHDWPRFRRFTHAKPPENPPR
jgi:hypothetical protein